MGTSTVVVTNHGALSGQGFPTTPIRSFGLPEELSSEGGLPFP